MRIMLFSGLMLLAVPAAALDTCDRALEQRGLFCSQQTGIPVLDQAKLACQEYGMDSPAGCTTWGGCPREFVDEHWRDQCAVVDEKIYDVFRRRADAFSIELLAKRVLADKQVQQYLQGK